MVGITEWGKWVRGSGATGCMVTEYMVTGCGVGLQYEGR